MIVIFNFQGFEIFLNEPCPLVAVTLSICELLGSPEIQLSLELELLRYHAHRGLELLPRV